MVVGRMAGKTHTMEGYDYTPAIERKGGMVRPPHVRLGPVSTGKTLGVVPTIIQMLFQQIEDHKRSRPGLHVQCRVSFIQIYKVRRFSSTPFSSETKNGSYQLCGPFRSDVHDRRREYGGRMRWQTSSIRLQRASSGLCLYP